MPELPEVETILRSLQPKALGHVIRLHKYFLKQLFICTILYSIIISVFKNIVDSLRGLSCCQHPCKGKVQK
jgi:formamidopyrimidine-DNA glycosylase